MIKLLKKQIKIFAAAIILIQTFSVNAQDQKTQFKKFGKSKLIRFSMSHDKDGNLAPNGVKSQMKFLFEEFNKDEKYLYGVNIKSVVNKNKTTSNKYYIEPNQQAHPNYFSTGSPWYINDTTMDVYVRFEKDCSKLIVIGDYIYKLDYDYSKKKHLLKFIFTKGDNSNTIKFYSAFNKVRKINHKKLIEDYLAKESKILSAEIVQFKKDNDAYYKRYAKESKWAEGDIVKSQQIAWEQRVGNAARVKNNTTRAIWVGFKSGGPSRKIGPGKIEGFACNVADIYLMSLGGEEARVFLFKPRSYCGKLYIVK